MRSGDPRGRAQPEHKRRFVRTHLHEQSPRARALHPHEREQERRQVDEVRTKEQEAVGQEVGHDDGRNRVRACVQELDEHVTHFASTRRGHVPGKDRAHRTQEHHDRPEATKLGRPPFLVHVGRVRGRHEPSGVAPQALENTTQQRPRRELRGLGRMEPKGRKRLERRLTVSRDGRGQVHGMLRNHVTPDALARRVVRRVRHGLETERDNRERDVGRERGRVLPLRRTIHLASHEPRDKESSPLPPRSHGTSFGPRSLPTNLVRMAILMRPISKRL
ncbi:hypothetical protein PsorP6_010284 [Peronosclerospora sorghi]|uniref:Uncharacterized protein n=1 Tax=Peronosclerospora sorghi TaxID=230839 RepID=A0ACC0VXH5_9STRA|nr:hypothetical protein PsorP6_010284 [Peronosclerospora sorghi]